MRWCLAAVGACAALAAPLADRGSDSAATGPTTTVIVMRHCIRSTTDSGISDVSGFKHYDDYSAEPWPAFAVPELHCTVRGQRISKAIGSWLKANAALPQPIFVIADNITRNLQTSQDLMEGLGLPVDQSTYEIDSSPFDASDLDDCKVSTDDRGQYVQEQLDFRPQPDDFDDLMAKLRSAMGDGAAGDWTTTPCAVKAKSGHLDGNCNAAAAFTERMLLEWGAGLEVAWGNLPPAQVPDVLRAHAWFRQNTDAVPEIVAKEQASIPHAVLAVLEAGKPGTTLFVGHDTQLNALNAVLDLAWAPSPFPVNSSMPNSALRFDLTGSVVKASFIFIKDLDTEAGEMGSVPATFGGIGSGHISLEDFSDSVNSSTVSECAAPTELLVARLPGRAVEGREGILVV